MKTTPVIMNLLVCLGTSLLVSCSHQSSPTPAPISSIPSSGAVAKVNPGSLPTDFPTSDLPLVKGEIISAVTSDYQVETGKNWLITISSKEQEIKPTIANSMAKYGFNILDNFSIKTTQGEIGIFANEKYKVTITVIPTKDADRKIIYYNISTKLA